MGYNHGRIIGWISILLGCLILFLTIDLLLKLFLTGMALWLIFYGFLLIGYNPKYTMQQCVFRIFR
jgi:ABC-type uncharacterized transport system permease subunit